MKRVTLIGGMVLTLALFGCTNPEPQPEAEALEPAAAAEPAGPAPEGVISANYIDAAAALAADDFAKAKASLTAFAEESAGELQNLARTAADAADIQAMRHALKPLSELVSRMELPEGHAVAYCPMFEGGAKWVQKRETLANPYFGAEMLTCGSFIN